MEKITVPMIRARKGGERITMLTAYDFPFAQLVDAAGMEIILVGDSVGNAVLGYPNTLPVTVEEMIHHTAAVVGDEAGPGRGRHAVHVVSREHRAGPAGTPGA